MAKRKSVILKAVEQSRKLFQQHMENYREALRRGRACNTLKDDEPDIDDIDHVLALIEGDAQMLRQVDAALKRLKNGTYGRCSDCSEHIGAKRLHALPFTPRCRDCQEELDAQSRQHLRLSYAMGSA